MKKIKLWLSMFLICLVLTLLAPMKAQAAEVKDSGSCGENLTWTLTTDGVLTISGEGEMEKVTWYGYWESITEVVIEPGVTNIEAGAFEGCYGLTSVELPDSVTSIGRNSFDGCMSLTSVALPNSLTSIGNGAFLSCTSLTSVALPDSLTSIGNYAFADCVGLTSVTIGKGVTSIGDETFFSCKSLTSVALPDSLTSIGGRAFLGCSSLTSVEFPDSLTSIGYDAFDGCSGLTSITLPDSVTNIGDGAFFGCNALKTVYYTGTQEKWEKIIIEHNGIPTNAEVICVQDSGKTGDLDWILYTNGCLVISGTGEMADYSYPNQNLPWYQYRESITEVVIEPGVTSIGGGAFNGCIGLTSVELPDSVMSIGYYAFEGCIGLTSVELPDSVTSIGYNAFEGCSGLTSVELPDSVTSIGSSAFADCMNLTEINVDVGNRNYSSADGVLFNKDATIIWCYPAGKTGNAYYIPDSVTSIGYSAFKGCTSLAGVTIPDSVTSIGGSAFWNCDSLTSVTLPDSVTSIGDYAFYDCSGLTSVELPDSVTSIGYSAFYGCIGLTSVELPDSVTSIGYNAFEGCIGLTSVELPDSVTSIRDGAFYGCIGLTSVTMGNGLTSIGNYAFEGCIGLTSVELPDSVMSIGYDAFRDCTSLASVTIPDGVTNIGNYAFYGCSGLTSVELPDGLTNIGYNAFEGCSGLTSVELPDGLTNIGGGAFYGCSGLTSVELPDSVTSIGGAAFYGCSGLTSVTMGNGVTSIGNYAFKGCSSLTSVELPDSVTSIGDGAFEGCIGLTSVTMGNGVTSIGGSAFEGCSGLTSVTMGNGVTSIGGSAFEGCSGLTSVELPDSVTSIGAWAFSRCIGLTSVTMGNGVTSIGDWAFYDCRALKTVYYTGTEAEWTALTNGTLTNADIVYIFDRGEVGSLNWRLHRNGLLVISGEGAMPDYQSESAPWYAYRESVAELRVESGVTGIGAHAFEGCSALADIDIPDSVTSIGENAFLNCSALEKVYYSGNAAQWESIAVGGGNADLLQAEIICVAHTGTCGYRLTWLLTHSGVLTISGEGAMYDYGYGATSYSDTAPWFDAVEDVVEVVIHQGVTTIGDYAFRNCTSLTSITLPDSVTSIGDYAFWNCDSLTSITLPDSVTSMGRDVFRGCIGLASVTLPGSLRNIGFAAFEDCTSLTSVTMGNGVTVIGNYAFRNCTSLISITLPDSVEAIYSDAFSDCTSLSDLVLGSSVTTIYDAAFDGCSALKTVYYTGTQEEWEKINIENNSIPTNVEVICVQDSGKTEDLDWILYTNGCLVISGTGEMADYSYPNQNSPWYEYRESITEVRIEPGVTSIGDNAFRYHMGLTSIMIPDSVTTIENSVFFGCTGLVSITIGEGVQSIGDSVIHGCIALREINVSTGNNYYSSIDGVLFDKNVTKIFIYPKGNLRESYTIPDGVMSIERDAFSNCENLTNITIPDSVTFIYSNAFYYCTNLQEINVSAGNSFYSDIDGVLFNKDATIICIYPMNKTGECYVIPDSVTTIGEYAFENCSGLTSITFPDSVTNIGYNAFSGCNALKTVYYTGTEAEWTAITIGDNNSAITNAYMVYIFGCGEMGSLNWMMHRNGLLVISGEGAMPDHDSTSAPWYEYRESVAELRVESGVTGIGAHAFEDCSALAVIDMPDSVTSIGENAFLHCSALEKVHYSGNAAQWESIAVGGGNTDLLRAEIICVAHAGTCGDNLTWLLTHSGVLTISGEGAMADYGSEGAPWYEYRYFITEMKIAPGVTSIGSYAFSDCTSLIKVTIPQSVSSIGYSAFDGCTALRTVYYTGTDREWAAIDISSYNGALVNADIEYNVLAYGETGTLGWILYNDGLLVISGTGAMPDYESIEAPWYEYREYRESVAEVRVESGVMYIGAHAFADCDDLAIVEMPNSVTGIGENAFSHCSELAVVYYPGTAVQWRNIAVGGGNADLLRAEIVYVAYTGVCGDDLIWTLTRSGTLIIRGNGAMYDYSSSFATAPWNEYQADIVEVVIHQGVTGIGDYAFYNCVNLGSVTLPESITSIGSYSFGYCNSLAQITIPNGVKNISSYAFYYCISLTQMTIPNGVQSISPYAFYHCTSLTSMILHDSVTSIGEYSFYYCNSLQSIVIPRSIDTIESNAFTRCWSLNTVYYIGSEEEWDSIWIRNPNEELLGARIIFNYDPLQEKLEVTMGTDFYGIPTLTWNEITGAEKYEIWRADGNGGFYLLCETEETTYSDANAPAGISHFYMVRAVAGEEKGAFSDIVVFRQAEPIVGVVPPPVKKP